MAILAFQPDGSPESDYFMRLHTGLPIPPELEAAVRLRAAARASAPIPAPAPGPKPPKRPTPADSPKPKKEPPMPSLSIAKVERQVRSLEAAERAKLLASRPDVTDRKLLSKLAKMSPADIATVLSAIPRGLPPEQKRDLDERMGLAPSRGIRRVGARVEYSLTPAEARTRLANGGSK